ncbi:glucosamine-6-phosphate deaminase [Natronincola ferrireducens]|uniref:Glucosamine-6-phosphate deaminase n=1 Tax=Natronincola ferrireducens TaxID=393762 RepID=A0A1G8YRP8_9FIRM|nr:glucosamine-6-phosphate deaminase [Natronincola ferrireducens]SDK05488.1 glucosamine-6-phosphate deaminase [Natronincola ferrireducens]
MRNQHYGEVNLKIFKTREDMGVVAAREASEKIIELLGEKKEINCVFAAAPSQNEFLQSLLGDSKIDWSRINGYHMDEYIGLSQENSRSFTNFLNTKIFNKVPFKSVNLLNGLADPQEECNRYEKLLKHNPIDIVFMGIGENGHIAFNDPGVAKFQDERLVKIVELEESCKVQQVNDGCFPTIEDVPQKAITLTIPALVDCKYIFCVVPSANKAKAVTSALKGEISEVCPASILRRTKNVNMYIDEACAALL